MFKYAVLAVLVCAVTAQRGGGGRRIPQPPPLPGPQPGGPPPGPQPVPQTTPEPETGLTQDRVDELKDAIRDEIEKSQQGPFLKFIPGFVRLSFHDCVGGCDGCVNLQNPSNAGLADYVFPLDLLYTGLELGEEMSRADFWALAGIVAVEMGAEKAGVSQEQMGLTFKWGRKDCDSAPETTEVNTFPDASQGLDHILDFFQAEFGFNAKEVTALMGAHTLGATSPANSGYRGPWVPAQDSLDNAYYRDLVNRPWNQNNVARPGTSPRWQWNNGPFMMLNTDMCLARTIKVDANGQDTCPDANVDCSGQPETVGFVDQYATDQATWLVDFAAVFTKMIEHTAEQLQEPAAAPAARGEDDELKMALKELGKKRQLTLLKRLLEEIETEI